MPLLVYGTYHFKPKKLAFRNDYCWPCEQPRRAYRISTIDVGHLYYLPLIPVGRHARWLCASCGRDPHTRVKTRRSFKFLGLLLLCLGTVAFWQDMDKEPPEEKLYGWFMRFALPVAAAWVAVTLFRSKPDIILEEKLALVEPAGERECPEDGVLLVFSSTVHCPQCGITRESSPAQ